MNNCFMASLLVYDRDRQIQHKYVFVSNVVHWPRENSITGILLHLHCTMEIQCRNYNDVIIITIASQIFSVSIIYSTVCSGADQIKNQSPASLASVKGIHRWPVNSPHKWLVTWKTFPFDDVIMVQHDHTNATRDKWRAWWSIMYPVGVINVWSCTNCPM